MIFYNYNHFKNMLNKNHVADIRTCQRIKFDQALYILTMYEKKIRNQINYENQKPLDAEKQYDEKIVRSWNGKWKLDLTKPLLNCVTSVSPRVILDIKENQQSMQRSQQLDKYNRVMIEFIRRMRAEHEDQSNFKLTQININQQLTVKKNQSKNQSKTQTLKTFAQLSFTDFLSSILQILQQMDDAIVQNGQIFKNYQITQSVQQQNPFYLQIKPHIQQMIEATKFLQQNCLTDDLKKFISTCTSVFESVKQSEQGSTLITVQPKVYQLTYLLHPLFLPIYSFLFKQKVQQDKKSKMQSKDQKKENKRKQERKQQTQKSYPFKNFFNSNTSSLSKVVFINLDGYESQFNLQFARTFRKNMLYISFPKQDIHYANDMNSVYEQRLYKKIMYNWQKNKINFNKNKKQNNSMDEQMQNADILYEITHNIQRYYDSVQKILYKNQSSGQDINRNIYIFPLRLYTLNQNFNNLVPEDQDDTIQVYESHAILQIFKYFLVNQIKQFGATCIIVSHSGRLNIDDNHFVQIMQQLTKLSHYKLIYFPNLTTRFCEQKSGIDHEINIQNIDYLQRSMDEQMMQDNNTPLSYDFFNKIARFLKVSSGTYSLVKNFEEEDLISKHRNLKVLKRINKLMEVLGNQYENIQRMRFKSNQIQLIPKLYEKDSQKIVKAFEKLVPLFYQQLYFVLESIIALHILPSQTKPYQQLKKFNINVEVIRSSYIIKQLIHYIKTKIIARQALNQADKNKIAFEKMKKYLHCQKQKHFLQISQEKYEDSVIFHFKTGKNYQIYDNVTQGKPNFSGLINLSFSNPSKNVKESMHIYQSTQILYKIDQSTGTGPIPILLMNHLPLQRKGVSKFDNYCAFLSRQLMSKLSSGKGNQQGIQRIQEQKKIKPYLIKLFDDQNRQIIQNKFQFRVEWNFCQTDNYMILYWPQMFNFIQAVSYKLQSRNYQPPLTNQIFMAKKQFKNDCVSFYRVNFQADVRPRTGCSAYQFRDFIYILGGFYDKQANYLQLQRDVTLLNLQNYDQEQNRKVQIINLKDDLYEPLTDQNIKNKLTKNKIGDQNQNKRGRVAQSYVRPRREFQFYDMEDLCDVYQPQQGVKSVIMIGGVGQNFIHPFSLLTYYFYELKIQVQTKRLVSINKHIIYNRSVPVNISKPSKNMGIIKTPIRSKNQSTIITKPQLTQPHSYARFRIVYKIQQNELKFKFQYIFSQKDCKILKEQLRKCQQDKYEVTDISNIRIEKIQGNNHNFIAQKPGFKNLVHLRLEIDGVGDQRQQQHKLTNQSIYYLNIINGNYICAIVKHPKFTQDKSLLVQCKVKNIQNENRAQDQAPYVCLKPIHSDLKGDLTLHIIEASNINLIYILHGHRLYESNQIYEYQITHNRKSGLKTVSEIKPKKVIQQLSSKQAPTCCYSTFFYRKVDSIRNQIVCESYLNFQQDRNIITRVCQYFDPSDSSNTCWNLREPIKRYMFYLGNSNKALNLQRLTFLEFFRQEKIRQIIIQFNRKKYYARINDEQQVMEEYIPITLEEASEVYLKSLEQQQCQRGTILSKKLAQYQDRGYTRIQ